MIAWLRRRPNAVAIILVVAVAAGGLWSAHLQRIELCEKVEGQRALLAALVDTAIAEDDAGLRLTALPEFQALDPETQTYLAALERGSQQRGSEGTEARLRQFRAAHLAPAECG